MHRRLVLPPGLAARPFTVAEGRAAGLSPDDLRSVVLRRPFRGVRVPADLTVTLATTGLAAHLALPDDAAFDGATAAALHRLPLPRGLDPARPLVVRVAPGGAEPRVAGIRTRVGPRGPASPRPAGRVRTVPVAQCWAALAADPTFPADELVVVGDALTRRDGSTRALLEVADRYRGRRGAARMRAALTLVRERVDSPQETRTRLLLVHAGIPEPEVNLDVHAGDGSGWLFRPDLRWLGPKVAVEYDGRVHVADDERRARDHARRTEAELEGWRVVVAVSVDLGRGRTPFVRRVEDTLRSRGLRW